MNAGMTARRGLLAALTLMTLGVTALAPHAAWAEGDKKGKGKDGKVPIIIAPPIVTDDKPAAPPKKK